ncbi:MAG TPA: site-2 protease family protein [Rhizomicrobium sp.]|nr:site-2 protease family protein [Rhizomicrobium sp.]
MADPLQTAEQIAQVAIPIIVAITLHEAAHGYAARHFGDDTAARAGRISLNPLRHIDLFGTILLPGLLLLSHAGFVFGYAKPVPVNFAALRNPKRDMVWVAAAGPGMNVLLALLSGLALFTMLQFGGTAHKMALEFFWTSVEINLVLAVFNLLPVPPLDGGRVAVGLLPQPLSLALAQLNRFGMLLLIAIFILLPLIGINLFHYLVQIPVEFLERPLLSLLGIPAQ